MSDTQDFLEHYGIVGMHWGKRSGGLKSRVKGSVLDTNQRYQSINKRAVNGTQTREEKIFSAPARLALGKKRYQKLAAKRLGKLEAAEERINSGKLKARDVLSGLHTVTAFSLVVSQRDNKRDHV